jgi:Cdc6-like AAA superfamily ATPase
VLSTTAKLTQTDTVHLGPATVSAGTGAERTVFSATLPSRRRDPRKLTPHQLAVYEVIAEHDAVSPGELYDAYCERVDKTVNQCRRRR